MSLFLNSRSVSIEAACWILEAEQDYGDQTRATPTLPRVYVLRRVLNVILVRIQVQCVKSEFLVKSRNVVYAMTRSTVAHNKQISWSVLRCVVRTRMAFDKIKSLALTEEWLVNNDVFVYAQMCLWWAYEAHVSLFISFTNRKYVTPTMVGGTSAFCAVKTDRRL